MKHSHLYIYCSALAQANQCLTFIDFFFHWFIWKKKILQKTFFSVMILISCGGVGFFLIFSSTVYFISHSHVAHFFIQSLCFTFLSEISLTRLTPMWYRLCVVWCQNPLFHILSSPSTSPVIRTTNAEYREPRASSGVTSPIAVRVWNNSQIFLG